MSSSSELEKNETNKTKKRKTTEESWKEQPVAAADNYHYHYNTLDNSHYKALRNGNPISARGR